MLSVIYVPTVGKIEPKCARASGFLEKTNLSNARNEKALALMIAERYMSLTRESLSSLWQYKGTVDVDNRAYHYFMKEVAGGKDDHVWFATALSRLDDEQKSRDEMAAVTSV